MSVRNPFREQALKYQAMLDRMRAAEDAGAESIMTMDECRECEAFVARRVALADQFDAQQANPPQPMPLDRLKSAYGDNGK